MQAKRVQGGKSGSRTLGEDADGKKRKTPMRLGGARGARMVSNALDRAQLYTLELIAAGGAPETTKLAKDFYALADAMERPTSIDLLALAAPSRRAEGRAVRMMTGDEVTVLVPVTSTVAQVIDAAVSQTGASKEEGRTLVHAEQAAAAELDARPAQCDRGARS